MELEQIRNFVAIGERLATAGQPSEDELRLLAERGFEVVVNLGLLDPRYCLADEAGSVAALGMSYHHIPVEFTDPTPASFGRFRALLVASGEKKVFVHCAMNYRVACFTALFGERELGWSREQADAHVYRLWQPNDVWTAFMERMRKVGTG